MIEMNKQLLLQIDGGVNITGTLVSSLTKAINTILDLGRSLGTAIIRVSTGKICPIK